MASCDRDHKRRHVDVIIFVRVNPRATGKQSFNNGEMALLGCK